MTSPNGDKRPTRLDRELEEILARTDRRPSVTARVRSMTRLLSAKFQSSRSNIAFLDTAWGWFGLGVVIFLIGGWATTDSGLGRQIIELAGLGAIVIGVVRLVRPGARGGRKMWRGREINMRRPGVELGDKFDDWRKRR